ncbi:uncharacterized protein LOC117111652 [Anneissia japonica]|uniref:uncharacterized protein LOC117111652 n=1 Tax=Anneissia japonica TaxID=1529436 RepID=UPI001425A7DF|nr:uncharacterized protein LOC117111652 [Anneissia japonica]
MALKEFLKHVDQTYCNLHSDPDTVDHIYRATKQIVQHVMDEIGRRKPHLNIKEVISVGSFVEGTKNCSPNEFDFMVCFDFLSRKENIWIEGVDGCKPGYMVAFLNVKSDDDRMFYIIRQLYDDICCIHHVGVRREFIKVLGEVITPLSKKKMLTPQGILVLKGSEFLALKLEWHKFKDEYKGPDIYSGLCERDIHLETHYSLDIDVDIMPAVSVEDFSLLSDIHGFPTHIAEILENRKFHLVCKESGQSPNAPYLHISHATTEVFLVSHLNPIHKQCYKLLKYIFTHGTDTNRPIKDINLSSYVFKNAVLFHEYDKLCSGTPDTVTCCIEIIQYIRATLRQGVFPSFLMRTMNVWGQYYKVPIASGWRPTDLDEEINRFDWSLVLWFQLWRQFLGKALTIFQKIEMQLPTAEPESQEISISPEDPVSNCHEIVIYVSNKYEPFLKEFAILRKDASVIITEYSKTIYDKTESVPGKPPSERIWELVLPKFPEYLIRIERKCSRKLSIPKENFDEVKILDS